MTRRIEVEMSEYAEDKWEQVIQGRQLLVKHKTLSLTLINQRQTYLPFDMFIEHVQWLTLGYLQI